MTQTTNSLQQFHNLRLLWLPPVICAKSLRSTSPLNPLLRCTVQRADYRHQCGTAPASVRECLPHIYNMTTRAAAADPVQTRERVLAIFSIASNSESVCISKESGTGAAMGAAFT